METDTATSTPEAQITEVQGKQAYQDDSPFQNLRDLRAYFAQHPSQAKIYAGILAKWRHSTATRYNEQGEWAAYSFEEWGKFLNVTWRVVQDNMTRLHRKGLIEKTRGHYGGNRVVTFLRPTALALSIDNGTTEDWERIGLKITQTPAKTEDKASKTPKTPAIQAVWIKAIASHISGYQLPLTQKDKGQLNQIAKACPTDKANEIIQHVLANWITYAEQAGSDAGLHTTPKKPQIGFVLKHLQTAVTLWEDAQQQGQQSAQTPAQAPPDQPLTDEDMIALDEKEAKKQAQQEEANAAEAKIKAEYEKAKEPLVKTIEAKKAEHKVLMKDYLRGEPGTELTDKLAQLEQELVALRGKLETLNETYKAELQDALGKFKMQSNAKCGIITSQIQSLKSDSQTALQPEKTDQKT